MTHCKKCNSEIKNIDSKNVIRRGVKFFCEICSVKMSKAIKEIDNKLKTAGFTGNILNINSTLKIK